MTAGESDRDVGGPSRRSLLATTGALMATTSGCIRQTRSIVNRDGLDQLSLTITTLPADGDRESIQLARELETVLETVGIDVSIEMRSHEEFLRAVLINHDFDICVGTHPGGTDPDYLYETLHSRFADESGWQNPFGYTNLQVDELLERQRTVDPDQRDDAVAELLDAFAVEQPFVPICAPDEHRLVRTDRFDGWGEGHPATRLGYLDLEPADGVDRLRAVNTDARISENANPLMAEYRDQDPFVDLLYDSLATEHDGDIEPWVAEDWTWDDGTLTVTLRDDCRFHDGEPLRADDVEFTYRFLADTSLGASETPAPSPQYRGLVSAIDDVSADDDHQLTFTATTNEPVAERALTVPILPEHVWESRSEPASVPGVQIAQGTTEAVVTDNWPPIGSGPFRFDERGERDFVTLARFEDHVSLRPEVDLPEPTVDSFRVQIDPRSTSAIENVETDAADVTTRPLETYVIDDIEERDETQVLESPSWTFYTLGFNTRIAPFSNPRFRQAIAALVDRAWLVEEVFDGYASPIAMPVPAAWTPEDLAWDGDDPTTPFLGTDGDVDVDAARSAFEDAGFRYDSDGELRVRQ